MEMPGGTYFASFGLNNYLTADLVKQAIASGSIQESRVTDARVSANDRLPTLSFSEGDCTGCQKAVAPAW